MTEAEGKLSKTARDRPSGYADFRASAHETLRFPWA
jgi:hypothetical protein